MNTNKKSMNLVTRARNSAVGRICRRVLGEETGAVMMEYVVLAVLIAAAVAVGVWYFGRSINNELTVASDGVTGFSKQAETDQDKAQKAVAKQYTEAVRADKAYVVGNNEAAADIK